MSKRSYIEIALLRLKVRRESWITSAKMRMFPLFFFLITADPDTQKELVLKFITFILKFRVNYVHYYWDSSHLL